jgi:hypothetical protein
LAIFSFSKTYFRLDADQMETGKILLGKNEKPLREFGTLLEASQGHLWITPPSHFTPQKARG